jgi:2-oxo-3-hexenedioate decarboxylase
MRSFDTAALARDVKLAQDESRHLAPITSRHADFDLASAYEVAHRVHEVRMSEGAVPVGRKIGFTNPRLWDVFGVRDPVWGHVYDRTVVHATSPQVRCRIGRFVAPKIEPEIVVHLRDRPPIGAGVDELVRCIDWMALGFEIVQSHYPDWKFAAPDTVADSALHACLVVGEHVSVDHLGPELRATLERFSITLSCDGQVRDQGQGSNVMGSPLNAVSHLLDVVSRQAGAPQVQAGEIVTTGTLTQALTIQVGESWSAVLEGIALPDLTVEFTS